MSVTYSYGQFQQQIAFELGNRTDLLVDPTGGSLALTPIQQAIQNAIAKWEREHFYFNEIEAINTFNTIAGQEFYTSSASSMIGTNPHLDKVWVLISSNRYSLNPRTEQYLSDTSLNPSVQGQPIDYAMYAETMRLYPIPDGVYPVTLEGTYRATTLSATSSTNFWLKDAADLIRCTAKMDLYENVLQDQLMAQRMKIQIYGDPGNPMDQGYLYALSSENVQRTAVGKMRANYF